MKDQTCVIVPNVYINYSVGIEREVCEEGRIYRLPLYIVIAKERGRLPEEFTRRYRPEDRDLENGGLISDRFFAKTPANFFAKLRGHDIGSGWERKWKQSCGRVRGFFGAAVRSLGGEDRDIHEYWPTRGVNTEYEPDGEYIKWDVELTASSVGHHLQNFSLDAAAGVRQLNGSEDIELFWKPQRVAFQCPSKSGKRFRNALQGIISEMLRDYEVKVGRPTKWKGF